MDRTSVSVVIPAGGRGQRMGAELPKQFLSLGGRPILWHTLLVFERSPLVDEILLVLHPDDEVLCRELVLVGGGFQKVRCVIPAGAHRHESVAAGLRAVDANRMVLVHDAVRPFVTERLLSRVVDAARLNGAAIPVAPIAETVKRVGAGKVLTTVPRGELRRAQTPQAFEAALLEEAHRRWQHARAPTDDAEMVEAIGHPVAVVEGEEANVKITAPADLGWAEYNLRLSEDKGLTANNARIGQGVDVHALASGRPLILGGVTVPFEKGLAGHSDADVLTHAIIDALLGATGRGDIGRLFPDTDDRYKDISSMVLLREVLQLLAKDAVSIGNIDAVVMAQRPKLAPYVEQIRASLADGLGIEPERVSIKATTTERLGFVGREEGIMAQAVALVHLAEASSQETA